MVYGERECFTVGVTQGGSRAFVGLGFVTDDRRILTCAHVVNAALKRPDNREKEQPSPEELIHVNFPLLDSAAEVELYCRVTAWRPPAQKAPPGDVALLELIEGFSLPEGAASAMLARYQVALRKTVSIKGYIKDRIRRGEWAEPRVLGLYDHGRLIQLETSEAAAFKPDQGYSGSPVIFRTKERDKERDMVIGMFAAVMPDDEARDSYAIPVNVLADIVPGGLHKDWNARYRLPDGPTEPAYRLNAEFADLEEPARYLLTQISAVRMPVDFEFVRWLSEQEDDEALRALLAELVARDLLRDGGDTGYYELPDAVRKFAYGKLVAAEATHKRIAARLKKPIIEVGLARLLTDSPQQAKRQLLELMYQQVNATQRLAAAETWENLLFPLLNSTAEVTEALACAELLCRDDQALRRQISSTATRARLRLDWIDLALQAGKLDLADEVRERLADDPVAGLHAEPGQGYVLEKFRDLYLARALLLRGRFARVELTADAVLANIAAKRTEIAAATHAEDSQGIAVQLAELEHGLLSAKLGSLVVDNRLPEIAATRRQLDEVMRRYMEAVANQRPIELADTQRMRNAGVLPAAEPGTEGDEALERAADAAHSSGAITRELPMRMTIARRWLAADRRDAAKHALEEVARIAEKNGLRCYLPETYCLLAEVTCRLGDEQAARQRYDRAVSAATDDGIRHFEWILEPTRQLLESGCG